MEDMVFVLGWLLAGMLAAAPPSEKQLLRLAEEAEAFAQLATQIVGQESMEQILLLPPPRFRQRGEKLVPKFRTRRVVSEYGFAILQDDGNLHELRQVLQVDGKQVKKPGALRQTLSMGMKGEADRLKKKLLKEFEGYGLPQAATDFGQLILLFTKRQIPNFTFDAGALQYQGADQVQVVQYAQKESDATAVTVFEGKRVVRHRLQGEIWLRVRDGMPLRVTMHAARQDDKEKVELRHRAVVDYVVSSYGALLPASVTYNESIAGTTMMESRSQYTDFKKFGAASELKFTVDEEQPEPQKPEQKKPEQKKQ
jgi:hypothetical protein